MTDTDFPTSAGADLSVTPPAPVEPAPAPAAEPEAEREPSTHWLRLACGHVVASPFGAVSHTECPEGHGTVAVESATEHRGED